MHNVFKPMGKDFTAQYTNVMFSLNLLKKHKYISVFLFVESSPPEAEEACSDCCQGCPAEYTQFTVDEIINGKVRNVFLFFLFYRKGEK